MITQKLNLWQKVLLGMLLGILCGYLFNNQYLLFKPFATIYTNLVKMIVVPTVFFAIIYGITNISDINTIGKIGLKSSLIYGIATILAVIVGILFAYYLKPGIGVDLIINQSLGNSPSAAVPPVTFSEIFVNIFPSNPIAAMANGNTLQVIFFAFILGISLILAGDKARDARRVIGSATSAVFTMVSLVIKTTPYGAFAIMSWIIGCYGFTIIFSLGKLALTIMGAFAVQYLMFGVMLLCCRLNPFKFYRKTSNIQSIAFATSSSKATIMPAITDLEEKLGVSPTIASFVLPLGAAINMTGSAIYIVICAIFFAQAYGIQLTLHQYLILAFTSTIGSAGAAGYPSGAVIMLSMVLPTIGLPIDAVPLIMGIDRLLDMFRTIINVTGDCTATVIIDRLEHSLNLEEYNR